MSKRTISTALRDAVIATAKNRCEYCQTQKTLIGQPLEIDHIVPKARGGSSEITNLCLACPRCNRYKSSKVEVVFPDSAQPVPLFHPYHQRWEDHFAWSDNGVIIIGLTLIGRATVKALSMNNDDVVQSRHIWVSWGYHPPQ